jgi:hypothetical protein
MRRTWWMQQSNASWVGSSEEATLDSRAEGPLCDVPAPAPAPAPIAEEVHLVGGVGILLCPQLRS